MREPFIHLCASMLVTASAMIMTIGKFQAQAVNQPPACLKQLGAVAMTTTTPPCLWRLDELFTDDGQAQPLTFTCGASNPAVAIVDIPTINGINYYRVRGIGAGSTSCWLRAFDGVNRTTMSFTTTVTQAVNQCPVVQTPFSPVTVGLGGTPPSIELNTAFRDPDNGPQPLSFTFTQPSPPIAATSVITQFGISFLRITPITAGTATATVTASDGACQTPYTYTIQVVPNRPPVVAHPVGTICLTLNSPETSRDPNVVFSDPDGDQMTFTASSVNPGVALVQIVFAPFTNTPTLKVTAVGRGATTGSITAADGHGNTTTHAFPVSVNDPPAVIPDGQIPNGGTIVMDLRDAPIQRDLLAQPLFRDPEGDAFTHTVFNSAPNVASVEIRIQFSPPVPVLVITPLTVGMTNVTIRASDACGFTDLQFTVKTKLGAAPVLVNHINPSNPSNPDLLVMPLSQGIRYFTLNCPNPPNTTCLFQDPEGNSMTFTGTNSQANSNVATVRVFRNCTACQWLLEITPRGGGTTAAFVTADDGNNNQTTYTFGIKVTTGSAPVVAAPFSPVQLQVGGPRAEFIVANIFSDPDNDIDDITLTQLPDPSIAVAAFEIPPFSPQVKLLVIRPVGSGTTTGSITAADRGGNVTTYQFTIQVQ